MENSPDAIKESFTARALERTGQLPGYNDSVAEFGDYIAVYTVSVIAKQV